MEVVEATTYGNATAVIESGLNGRHVASRREKIVLFAISLNFFFLIMTCLVAAQSVH